VEYKSRRARTVESEVNPPPTDRKITRARKDRPLRAAIAAWGLRGIPPRGRHEIVMGVVYLVSTKVYLPVPHIQLYGLLPGGAALSEPLRLGLTLPACTLPLIVVVGMLAALSGSPWAGALAGLLFALALTAPTIWFGVWGTSEEARSALGKAAHLNCLTALGRRSRRSGDAGLTWTRTPCAAFEQAPPAAVAVAFLAGFVFSFNPVALDAIPVSLAYVTKAGEPRRAGSARHHVCSRDDRDARGPRHRGGTGRFAAGLGGQWVETILGRQWGLVLGPVLILLGLM
jgi:cytochrome c-type biogenesis protein